MTKTIEQEKAIPDTSIAFGEKEDGSDGETCGLFFSNFQFARRWQINLHTSATDGSRPRSVQAQQKAKSAFADWS